METVEIFIQSLICSSCRSQPLLTENSYYCYKSIHIFRNLLSSKVTKFNINLNHCVNPLLNQIHVFDINDKILFFILHPTLSGHEVY